MSDKGRDIRISVRLSADETARLDELRAGGSRSQAIRALLRDPNRASVAEATHSEAVALLADQARDGSATAAVALEKALRPKGDSPPNDPDDELDRILRGDR